MTDNGLPPGDTKNTGSSAPRASASGPVQSPMNLVTPVTIHDSWEDTYRQEEAQDSGDVDFKEYADGSIVISKQSLELIQRKLDAASKLKKRHLKILKIHEQLMEEHDNLLRERERPPQKVETLPALPPQGMQGDVIKAMARMEKINRALARCKWHEFKRRKRLLYAMKQTLAYMKNRAITQ
ncbi:MAG: hypothetical protein JEZ02_20905 [Desulfatibacillum sp.]|nr:hypothetical protein [Desulfatibacillum sp.]